MSPKEVKASARRRVFLPPAAPGGPAQGLAQPSPALNGKHVTTGRTEPTVATSAKITLSSAQLIDLVSSLLEGREAALAAAARHEAQGDAARVDVVRAKITRLDGLLSLLAAELQDLSR